MPGAKRPAVTGHSQRSVSEEQPVLPVLGISESEAAALFSSYIITNESFS